MVLVRLLSAKLINNLLDGRRFIDGKPEKSIDGVQLWHSVIKKKALSSKTDTDKEADADEEDDVAGKWSCFVQNRL